jgi:hypothetical protein
MFEHAHITSARRGKEAGGRQFGNPDFTPGLRIDRHYATINSDVEVQAFVPSFHELG